MLVSSLGLQNTAYCHLFKGDYGWTINVDLANNLYVLKKLITYKSTQEFSSLNVLGKCYPPILNNNNNPIILAGYQSLANSLLRGLGNSFQFLAQNHAKYYMRFPDQIQSTRYSTSELFITCLSRPLPFNTWTKNVAQTSCGALNTPVLGSKSSRVLNVSLF